MKIKLHLGAHKTATTHLQQMLFQNQMLLKKNSIKISIPKDLRQKWLPNVLEYLQTQNNALLETIVPKVNIKIWIISEENISGVSYDLKIHRGIYPFLKERMECFREIFQDYEIEIFFALRSYEEFYRSAYLEVVRNRGYIPFDEFYNEKRFENNSWVSVVDSLVEVFRQKSIVLWRYEDFRLLEPLIVKKITQLEDIDGILSSYQVETTRPSLSAKSLEVLKSFYGSGHNVEGFGLVEHLSQKYPVGKEFTAFMPFNQSQIDAFQAQYKNDIDFLRKNYPNIKFLSPPLW
jgi:hypothetical protein